MGHAVALGPGVPLAVPFPGAEVPAEVFPQGLVALELHGLDGVEGARVGHAVTLGEGLPGVQNVGDLHGVEGVPGGADDAVVNEVVSSQSR